MKVVVFLAVVVLALGAWAYKEGVFDGESPSGVNSPPKPVLEKFGPGEGGESDLPEGSPARMVRAGIRKAVADLKKANAGLDGGGSCAVRKERALGLLVKAIEDMNASLEEVRRIGEGLPPAEQERALSETKRVVAEEVQVLKSVTGSASPEFVRFQQDCPLQADAFQRDMGRILP